MSISIPSVMQFYHPRFFFVDNRAISKISTVARATNNLSNGNFLFTETRECLKEATRTRNELLPVRRRLKSLRNCWITFQIDRLVASITRFIHPKATSYLTKHREHPPFTKKRNEFTRNEIKEIIRQKPINTSIIGYKQIYPYSHTDRRFTSRDVSSFINEKRWHL